jgi:hypothetical protein
MNSYPRFPRNKPFSYSRWLELYKNSPFRAIPLGLCPLSPNRFRTLAAEDFNALSNALVRSVRIYWYGFLHRVSLRDLTLQLK